MKRLILVLSIFVFSLVLCLIIWYFIPSPAPTPTKIAGKTVCLNMIVKNEKDVIERCLESVLPFINYWVIVDTGSTDGTQDIIKKFMKEKGVPGELHERPWVNFSHNRNEALDLARPKADYIFITDADEYLIYDDDFTLPALDKDYYYMTLRAGGAKWSKIQLINTKHDWRFVGVIHEVLCPTFDQSYATLENVYNVYTSDGARSKDSKKYEKDAALLENALLEEPYNARYQYYLAKSYDDAQNPEKAFVAYQRRAATRTGYDEERFLSYLRVATLGETLNKPEELIIESYKNAAAVNPSRIEPYYYLSNYYRRLGNYQKAYEIAGIGMNLPKSTNLLFVADWMHDYGVLLEYSIAAYWIGKYDVCQSSSLELLNRDIPPEVRDCVQKNLGFANQKMLEQVLEPALP